MCGIAGVLFMQDGHDAPRRNQPAPAWCERVRRALAPRGPDGHGTFVDDGVALLHTRLALMDLVHGQQPLHTPDGRYCLVVNGEIYDRVALRARLEARGVQLRTRSDSELLLWALALDGARALDTIEGEYAFCFWDRAERRALLGRDPLGVKPLVLMRNAETLWFASEVKALCASLPERPPLDVAGVIEALVAPALSGVARTPFRGLKSLVPGTLLEVRAGAMRVVRQERFRFSATRTSATPEALQDALANAVRDRLTADVEVGAFLSGGVDSSALVAAGLAHGSTPLRCYTIRFDHHLSDAPKPHVPGSIVVGDDAPFVEELARRWPIQLMRVHAAQMALLSEIDSLGATQDRMAAWEQELSQRFLARAAARDLKAVLVGDAADETHFGYAFALTPEVSASPRALLERFGFSARRALLRPEHWPFADALDAEYRALSAQAGFAYGGDLGQNRLATATLLVARWLPRLLHNGDVHTLAFGLEARVPFADRRVLALAGQVGVEDAFHPFLGVPEKAFLRRALCPWLPETILARPKSALPRDDGMGPLFQQRLAQLLREPRACERLGAFFELPALAQLCDFTAAVDDIRRACLFSVLAFDAFLRHHVS
jgi:asparagine synthase (glutamine-hydrolysing)